MQIVEGVVAAVEQLGVDLCNRLDAACDVHLYTVVLVQALQKVEHHPPARVVLVHSDFLPDDALLLLHCFLGEIRMGHAIQQDFQRLLESVGAGKKVTGLVKAGKSIGRSTRLCIFFKGIALFAFKHLVLQIVGNPLRHLDKVRILPALKAGVDGTVLSRKHGVCGGKSLHRIQQHSQARGMLHPQIFFRQSAVLDDLAVHGYSASF